MLAGAGGWGQGGIAGFWGCFGLFVDVFVLWFQAEASRIATGPSARLFLEATYRDCILAM